MYPVHERFASWQGEGRYAGCSAFFIRLFGCPLHCPWCDSAGTWHRDYVPQTISKFSSLELVRQALVADPEFVVITGGEPTVHPLEDLIQCCHDHELPVHLETSGAFGIPDDVDYVTVSPKWSKKPTKEALATAHELKLIVEDPTSIDAWMDFCLPHLRKDVHIVLHPEWSKRRDPEVLKSITDAVVRPRHTPFRLHAGYQMHKLFGADALDNRSAPTVPLGGNPSLGF